MTSENSGLSRRTLAKGAAWAAPAVVVAAAAPMVSASPCLEPSYGGASCKITAGQKDYYLSFCLTNNCGSTLTFSIDRIENNSAAPAFDNTDYGPITLANGQMWCTPYTYYPDASNMAGKIQIWGWIGRVSGDAVMIAELPAPPNRDCPTTTTSTTAAPTGASEKASEKAAPAEPEAPATQGEAPADEAPAAEAEAPAAEASAEADA